MKRAALSLVWLSSLVSGAAFANPDGNFGLGNGQSGAFAGSIDNHATTLSADAASGSATITVVSAAGFAAGDLIMLWEPGGLSQVSGGTSVTLAGNQTGTRELARIAPAGITGNTFSITTSDNGSGIPLSNTFTASRHVQVLKVPEFTSVTIAGTITAPAWNPVAHTGGIIAFLAQGAVVVNGTLSANGSGFNGGAITVFNYVAGACSDQDVPNPNNGEGQTRGEGVAGNADSINAKTQGFGNVANGGGAGNCVQNGGGGGANAGAGGVGGGGPDISNQFAGNGGAFINYSGVSMTSQMTMGGGGGAGNQKTSAATSGRNGGGVIWFRASSLSGTGTISADGSTFPQPGMADGQGGGGAGGSIYIRLAGSDTFCSTGTVSARGSDGIAAPTVVPPTPSPVGAGGGGGGGRLFIQDSAGGCALAANVVVSGGLAGAGGGPNKSAGDDGSSEQAPPTRYCSTDGISTPACTVPTPACLTTINACVECVNNSTCVTSPKTICDSATNKCVQCLVNADCPASAPVCTGNVCAATCDVGVGDNCSRFTAAVPPKSHCEADNAQGKLGQCVECLGTSDCTSDAAPHCSGDVCGNCTGNTDCSSGHGINVLCSAGGACVQCNSNADCGSDNKAVCSAGLCVTCTAGNGGEVACNTALHGNQHCATSGTNNGRCVPCTDNTHCGSDANPVCNTTINACTPCSGANGGEAACNTALHSSQHCATSGANSGKCVACLDDTQCSGTTPACKTTDNTCRECTGTNLTQCGAGKPICANTNLCASNCAGESDCTRFGSAHPHCELDSNAFSGQCVRCRAGFAQNLSQCGTSTLPFCDPSSDNCVKCTVSGNSQCAQFGTTSICDPAPAGSGACVSCLVDADCLSPTAPHCVSHSCHGCDDSTATHGDESCGRFADAGVPACQPSDNVTQDPGQCHQCSFSNTSLCAGATPSCNFVTGNCQLCTVENGDLGAQSQGCSSNDKGHACQHTGTTVFCGCTTDTDCGGKTSGRVCDGVTHLCVDGCSRAASRNDCPSGQFCSSSDATATGVCTITCQLDPDCATMTTMPFCIKDAGTMGRCAGCRSDSDCGGATPVCEPDTKMCVQCSATRLDACSAATGSICLADDTCGCSDDSQCGAADSGRICDTQKCVTGCHALGGNGCPSGLICDGAGVVPGKCVASADSGGGCALGGSPDVSLGAFLLFALALVALRLRRRSS